MKTLTLAAAVLAVTAGSAYAGPINSACMASGKSRASSQLCGCIQQVADRTLSASDQRMAAKFFADPHRAQVVRQSDRERDEAFWQRYRYFGAAAEASCG